MLLNAYIIILIIMAFVAATIIGSGRMLEMKKTKTISVALSCTTLVGMTLFLFSLLIGYMPV